jgi:hypothetical protein
MENTLRKAPDHRVQSDRQTPQARRVDGVQLLNKNCTIRFGEYTIKIKYSMVSDFY